MELSTGFFQNKKEKASDNNYQKKLNSKTQSDPGNSNSSYLLRNLAKKQFSVTHLVVSLL